MMMKGTNTNHPAKGSVIKVEPITDKQSIADIKLLLADKPLDLALFTVGINTNLRASDLLSVTVAQVKGKAPGEHIELVEKKTKKHRIITLNNSCTDVINALIEANQLKDDDFLFTGKRGVITVPALNLKVKTWCRDIGLTRNYGSHTLRKTWGYHQRVTFGVSLPLLMVCFNHYSQRQTLDYLCIQPEEIKEIYANEL